MSYQRERGEAIALLTKHGLPYAAIETLLRAATTINRLAELACSSEAADRDRIPCPMTRAYKGLDPTGRDRATLDRRLATGKYPCLCDGEHDASRHAIPRIKLQDWQAEQRVQRTIDAVNKDLARRPSGMVAEGIAKWAIVTSGDPRGYTLRVIPPAYAEENKTRSEHDPRTIGIPPGPSRLRW